ncbi:MAG: nucleotide exchange factor GrpE [Aureispira sp.]|nr:nucleotide exchange factor GrpE [Aureispira sp.]
MSKKEIPVTDGDENEVKDEVVQENQEETTLEDSNEQEETEEVEAEEVAPKEEEPKKTKSPADELGDMKDKYLRLYAEFDNYRKRTLKERQDLVKMASQDVIKAILPAIDDMDRAIRIADADDNDETVPEGIRLVYNKLLKSLEQQGVKPMETTGVAFDPELHEALTKIPAPTDDLKGKIVDTIERGYYLNDKIVRYPKVVVGE